MGRSELQENIIELKGIGEKTGKLFNKIGVVTLGDLLYYFPRGYDLFDAPKRACDLKENIICACKLTIIGSVTRRHVRNLSIVAFEAADETGRVKMTFFNAPYLVNSIKSGSTYIFRGVVRKKGNFFSMDHPKMYKVEEYAPLIGSLQPRYPLTKGLSNNTVMKAVEKAFINVGRLEEFMPEEICDRLDLIGFSEALHSIHFPKNAEDLEMPEGDLLITNFLYLC